MQTDQAQMSLPSAPTCQWPHTNVSHAHLLLHCPWRLSLGCWLHVSTLNQATVTVTCCSRRPRKGSLTPLYLCPLSSPCLEYIPALRPEKFQLARKGKACSTRPQE